MLVLYCFCVATEFSVNKDLYINGEDLSCCSNKIESLCLRKCPYNHRLTNKACLSAITVTNIYESFTYKMAVKINWHRCGPKLRHCHPVYIFTLYATTSSSCSQFNIVLRLTERPFSAVNTQVSLSNMCIKKRLRFKVVHPINYT